MTRVSRMEYVPAGKWMTGRWPFIVHAFSMACWMSAVVLVFGKLDHRTLSAWAGGRAALGP